MASRTCFREVPRSHGRAPVAPEHLVAITTSWPRPRRQRPTDFLGAPDRLGGAAQRINVGGIEEGDAARRGTVEDGKRRGLVTLEPEGHGAETETRDRKAGTAELDVAHGPRE